MAENVSTETSKVADIKILDRDAKKSTRIGIISTLIARRTEISFAATVMRSCEKCLILPSSPGEVKSFWILVSLIVCIEERREERRRLR